MRTRLKSSLIALIIYNRYPYCPRRGENILRQCRPYPQGYYTEQVCVRARTYAHISINSRPTDAGWLKDFIQVWLKSGSTRFAHSAGNKVEFQSHLGKRMVGVSSEPTMKNKRLSTKIYAVTLRTFIIQRISSEQPSSIKRASKEHPMDLH